MKGALHVPLPSSTQSSLGHRDNCSAEPSVAMASAGVGAFGSLENLSCRCRGPTGNLESIQVWG